MTIRTGVLKHSPLTYALASVRFAPWPLLAKKMDEIQDDLRDIAPLINRIQLAQVGPDGQVIGGNANAQEAWMLMPSDKSYGIQFAQDQLLLITNSYTSYTNFESVFSRALDTLLKYMRFIHVTNMGVRYIDHIKPRETEATSDYITEKLLPPQIDGHKNSGGHVFGEYTKGELKLRVNSVSIPGALPIPQDMIGLLVMLHGHNQPITLEALKPNELLLDMDAIYALSAPEKMESIQLLGKLNELHSLANGFFRQEGICTDLAFKAWKGEQ